MLLSVIRQHLIIPVQIQWSMCIDALLLRYYTSFNNKKSHLHQNWLEFDVRLMKSIGGTFFVKWNDIVLMNEYVLYDTFALQEELITQKICFSSDTSPNVISVGHIPFHSNFKEKSDNECQKCSAALINLQKQIVGLRAYTKMRFDSIDTSISQLKELVSQVLERSL